MNCTSTNQPDRRTPWGLLHGTGAFAAICLGQVISLCGSHLTSFVLGIWVYQHTRSATNFALISFFAIVPEIVLSPLAGAMADRWSRRMVLVAGNIGAAICSLALVILALTGQLAVWPIYGIVAANSAFQAVQYPALSASIPLWISEKHLSRANAVVELGSAVAMILAPALAPLLLGFISFRGIFVIDVVTFAFAVTALVLADFPRPLRSLQQHAARPSLLNDALQGWRYVQRRRELLALLILFAVTNFAVGSVQALLPPLVLSFSSAAGLGIVMAFAGSGAIAGGLLLSFLGETRRKIRAILLLVLLQGLVLFLGVLRAGIPLIAGAAFVFSFCVPVIFASSQTIWQTEVEQEMQARAFAIRRLVAWSTLPFAYLIAGPLADRIFEPLMSTGGALANSAGALIGTGPGRGIALLFILLGLLIVAAVLSGLRYQPFWKLEEHLLLAHDKRAQKESSSTALVTSYD